MKWPKITHSLFSNMMQDFIMYEDRKKKALMEKYCSATITDYGNEYTYTLSDDVMVNKQLWMQ